jgi:hypothetical protein
MQPDTSTISNAFDSNFPAELLQTTKVKSFLGGIFDPKKAGGMERLIFKVATKQTEYIDTIDNAKIQTFVDALK